MADRKISDLTALTAPASGDYLPIVDISEASAANKNKRITIEELFRGAPDGTAAAPSIGFESDPNTGIYSPGADQVAISTNGTGRLVVDSTGQIEAKSLGSAAAPTWSFVDDTNTGIYSPGADQLALATNGTGRLFVDANGNVGINASPPTAANAAGYRDFLVKGGSTNRTGILRLQDGDGTNTVILYANEVNGLELRQELARPISLWTNGTEKLRITSDGKVGIGVTSPARALDVNGSIQLPSNNALYISGSNNYFYADSSALEIGSATQIIFTANGSQRARIDSSGRLLVGTSSAPSGSVSQYAKLSVVGNTSNAANGAYFTIGRGSAGTGFGAGVDIGQIIWTDNAGAQFASIGVETDAACGTNDFPGRLVFSTTADGASSPTERMRITNGGWFKASNTGDYYGISANIHEFNSNQNNGVLKIHSRIASGYTDAVLTSEFTGYAPNNTTARFLYCGDTTAERCTIRSDGGIANFSANNVNLSDRNYKKDIAPAAGTWDCLKAWEIVNFRYIDQPESSDLNMGVIAQQVAESCPEVITVFQEAKEATENYPAQKERLGIKDQQMMWMAIKALQEAQLRIETLETKVAALEGN